MTPAERKLRARLGAYSLHAQGKTNTGPATAAYAARWDREVDPDGLLDPVERAKRAEAAKKAHYTRMAFASARARSRKAAASPHG
jgi:hypothetical protein